MTKNCVYISRHPSGLFYVGKSQTSKIEKGYKGSGIKLNRFWKNPEFDKSTWIVEVLYTFDTAQEAYLKEEHVIAEVKSHSNCLNLAFGGVGGRGMTGRKHSEETRQRMKQSSKASYNTEEIKRQRSERMKAFWADPANKQKRISSMNTPAAIKNRSEAGKRRFTFD